MGKFTPQTHTLLTRRPPNTRSTMFLSWEDALSSVRLESKQCLSSLSNKHWRNSWASSCWYRRKTDEISNYSWVKNHI